MAASVRLSILVLLASWATSTPVLAQNPQARDWAGACTGCHSSSDDATADRSDDRWRSSTIPTITGMNKAKFIGLMTAFREGTRFSTVMHQLAVGLSKEQIDALGDYFANQRPQ